jgi:2,4-dienoyl-CoA reductase-like NADH-dependent reductase (Old Yellow Enzyme family)/thioredoxin reductase
MFKNIFQPILIGKLEIPNRLVVPAMVVNYCDDDGNATEKYINYHEAKAKGGWGLIITENHAVEPAGKGFKNVPGLWNNNQIESHKKLTNRIHRHGAKIFAQIYHAGRQTSQQVINRQPVAPSPIPCPSMQEIPHVLTIDEIQQLVEKFGDCAKNAKEAGFDGIEIHGAHGYLIAQFLSFYSNKRTDEYGGNLLNRMRFALEIIANIRSKVGDNFPISFRISGDELVPGGRNIEDTKAIAMILENAGINALHISAGLYGASYGIVPPAAIGHGWLTSLADEIKRVVGIPVITVGRINDPWLAEAILASGKADLVAMGRASLADPQLPNKIKAGRFDEINYCIGCMQGCSGMVTQNRPATCLVNPTLGKEGEILSIPASVKKKILVVGGGPAGMEASIEAAKRGHEVHLLEKNGQLGGQLNLAVVPPNKGEIATFIRWQKVQIEKNGVFVHLNSEFKPETIETLKPDIVIVATGSKPLVINIPGVSKLNTVTAHEVLEGKINPGQRVAIIGGGITGAETASFLANNGKNVTIIEQLPEIARNLQARVRYFLMQDLIKNNVNILTRTTVKQIDNDCLIVCQENNKEEKMGPFDTLILACGVKSEDSIISWLEGKVDYIIIGDAKEVGTAMEAVADGFLVGNTV